VSSDLNLPIDGFLPDIIQGIQNHQNLILSAAPGSGKTTRFPPALTRHFQGKIWVLEPRRMAAIAAAHRIAHEQNWTVGNQVGFQVRQGSRLQDETQLVFMTEALLTRHLLKENSLNEVDIVILDEFHERSIHVDLALGILREMQELGSKIKIVVMSATLDSHSLEKYFSGTSKTICVPGVTKELKIQYSKTPQILSLNSTFFDNCFKILKEAFANSQRDILFFLPGTGEMRRLQDQLKDWAQDKKVQILPLHGSLSLEEQTRALQRDPQGARRLILSTNVAESSVTVDGVDVVVDSGLARIHFFDPVQQIDSLNIKRISKSSAKQRAGRAARQYDGVCYRMWTHLDESSMSEMETPEIQRTDLSETLLYLAALGISDAKTFSWYMPPPENLLNAGYQTLRQIEALSQGLTEVGKQLLFFPLPVRLGRVMLESHRLNRQEQGALICALMQEKDFISKEHDWLSVDEDCDITYRCELLRELNSPGRQAHHDRTIQIKVATSIWTQTQELLKIFKNLPSISTNSSRDLLPRTQEGSKTLPLSEILLPAFSDRICRRRKDTDRAVMIGGRGFRLAPQSVVTQSEFFIALQIIDTGTGSDSLITMATPLTRQEIEISMKDRLSKQSEVIFDEERGKFYRKEIQKVDDLPLEDGTVFLLSESELEAFWPDIFEKNFNKVLSENTALRSLFERLHFLKEKFDSLPSNKMEFVEEFFERKWDLWKKRSIEEAAYGESSWKSILEKDLAYHFQENLPQPIKILLLSEIPGSIQVPSQSWIPIQYQKGKAPFIEVRIQEIFGLEKSPSLFFDQIPLSFHLLGPNFRPVQITNDLASFWKNAYCEVRKELRLKYPKHQWPEDPRMGIAEAKGRRR